MFKEKRHFAKFLQRLKKDYGGNMGFEKKVSDLERNFNFSKTLICRANFFPFIIFSLQKYPLL